MHVEKSAHSEPIHSLDVSKDGNYLATCSSDKTIAIWETRRMRKLHTFYGHMDIVTAVSFSPNGKHLVSAGGTFDPTIKLWDAEIYKMLPRKEYPPEIVGINKGFYKSIPVNGGKSIMHERTEKSSHGRDFDVENEVEDGQVEEGAPDNDDHLKGNGARKNRRREKALLTLKTVVITHPVMEAVAAIIAVAWQKKNSVTRKIRKQVGGGKSNELETSR